MRMINAFLLLALACFSGCAFRVPLSDNFSNTSLALLTGNKLPLNVGVFIDNDVKTFERRLRPNGIGGKAHKYVFSVGEKLSKIILDASKLTFGNAVAMDSLPISPSDKFDAFLIVQKPEADIQFGLTSSGAQAAMAGLMGPLGVLTVTNYKKTDASLSVSARMVDSNLQDIFTTVAHGKGQSLVQETWGSKLEDFGGGVNDAMQDLARNLMTEILSSQKIKDYAASIKT